MDETATRQVRSFNRSVTQRIGALQDEYLARGRPLGASRVLWEIGDDGTDLRVLRARLDLDSGYLSRLVRSLEQDGLVVVEPGSPDKRVRTVRLTDAGRAERELLDRRSDELASSLLAPLSDAQRDRLVDAMGVVERLLTAGLVEVDVEDPASTAARFCIESYFAELDTPLRHRLRSQPEHLGRRRRADRARRAAPGRPAARRADRLRRAEAPRTRARGDQAHVGRGRRRAASASGGASCSELEQRARERGVGVVRLETNRTLREASGLYRSAGYVEVEAFNDEPYAHHWFEKRL